MAKAWSRELIVGEGEGARRIVALGREGTSPGVVWLGGFMSDMAGTKASALDAWAAANGRGFLRFDYSGHGVSGGRFEDGTITRWLEEAERVIGGETSGPQILVGSSMGGWIALLLAERFRVKEPGRIAGLVLLAPAVDMTKALMLDAFTPQQKAALDRDGHVEVPSEYSVTPYRLTRGLIVDGERHLFGERLIETGCPVHVIQGGLDRDVPPAIALKLVSHLASDDVVLTLVKDGDHRLSRPGDIDRIVAAVEGLIAEIA